jgi:uncharacterized protein (DUF58 family)
MVRDYEQEERDLVWLLVDASVELWAGVPGSAPLDHFIDEAIAVADAHLGRGDQVGLVVCGARVLARLPCKGGPAHAASIASALISTTTTLDADRSGLDIDDVASRVLEHLRPLDASGTGMRRDDRGEIARRAYGVVGRAPFPPLPVNGIDPPDRALRAYLSAFGIPSPPRLEPDRPRTDETLARTLSELAIERPHPSIVYLWSPMPDPERRSLITEALTRFPRRKVDLRWVRPRLEDSVPGASGDVERAVAYAVGERARLSETVGERALRKLGVGVERVRQRAHTRQSLPPAQKEPT